MGTGPLAKRWESKDQAISAVQKDAEKQSETRMAITVDRSCSVDRSRKAIRYANAAAGGSRPIHVPMVCVVRRLDFPTTMVSSQSASKGSGHVSWYRYETYRNLRDEPA